MANPVFENLPHDARALALPDTTSAWWTWWPWLTLAVCVLLAAGLWWWQRRRTRAPSERDPQAIWLELEDRLQVLKSVPVQEVTATHYLELSRLLRTALAEGRGNASLADTRPELVRRVGLGYTPLKAKDAEQVEAVLAAAEQTVYGHGAVSNEQWLEHFQAVRSMLSRIRPLPDSHQGLVSDQLVFDEQNLDQGRAFR